MIRERHTLPSRVLLLENTTHNPKLVNVDSCVVSKAVQERSKILAGERKSWLYTERKSRSDAVSEDLK